MRPGNNQLSFDCYAFVYFYIYYTDFNACNLQIHSALTTFCFKKKKSFDFSLLPILQNFGENVLIIFF